MAVFNIDKKIRDIGPVNGNISITGIVIRKLNTRTVVTKRNNDERSVLCFTLRDSVCDLINVNAWGSVSYIEVLNKKFQVTDVVRVSNVQAVFRKVSEGNDSYQPAVTSPFYLAFIENQSEIYQLNKSEKYLELLNIPSKPPSNFLTISDIQLNGNKLRGQFVNLLAGIRDMKEVRQVCTKNQRKFKCRTVILIDQSYSTLHLRIYEDDILSFSENWQSKNTVLFLADVRVEWNTFLQTIITSTTGRTIITVNPKTNKAKNLKNFLMSASFQSTGNLDQIINKYTAVSITAVMSCFTVTMKANEETQNNEFTALVYAVINSFDIDSSGYFLVNKCMNCNSRLVSSADLCLNSSCLSGNGSQPPLIDTIYDLRITLTDHTGSLLRCKLTNLVAERLIGCKASLFNMLTDEEKTTLKWKYLLKYCAAKLVVLPLKQKQNSIISVISVDLISLSSYSSLIPVY